MHLDGCDMRLMELVYKTDIPVNNRKGIMKTPTKYWCSEDHIQAEKATQNLYFVVVVVIWIMDMESVLKMVG